LNTTEQQLFDEIVEGKTAELVLRTNSYVDAGLWWRKRPLWLCVLPSEILLLAVGRRRFCERIALSDCLDIRYNPSSAELVIEPEEALRFSRLKMPASAALKIISSIQQNSNHNHQATC